MLRPGAMAWLRALGGWATEGDWWHRRAARWQPRASSPPQKPRRDLPDFHGAAGTWLPGPNAPPLDPLPQLSASVCKRLQVSAKCLHVSACVFLCCRRVLYLEARFPGCLERVFRARSDRSGARTHHDPRRPPAPSGRSKCSCNIRSKTAAGRHTRPAAPRHPVWEPRADPSWRPAGGRAQVGPGVGEAYRAGWNPCTGGRKNRIFAIPLTPITGGVDHHNAAPARLRYPKGAP